MSNAAPAMNHTIADLTNQITALKNALRPFAEAAARSFSPAKLWHNDEFVDVSFGLRIKDLRAARAAIGEER